MGERYNTPNDIWARREYRLIAGEGKHRNQWFIIRADEVPVFCHWCSAEDGRGHYPTDFRPTKVSGPCGIVFTDWHLAGGDDGCHCAS